MKLVTFLLCIYFGIVATLKHPRDLTDVILKHLNQLQSIVEEESIAARNDLDALSSDFTTYTANMFREGKAIIEGEQLIVDQQLKIIKDLGNAAGKDTSLCTEIREQTLNRQPDQYRMFLIRCLGEVNHNAQDVIRSARYTVNDVINKVHELDLQILHCREGIFCLFLLLTDIELNKIKLPQNIRTEVQVAKSLSANIRPSFQTCSDTHISGYISLAYFILGDIQACIDRIPDLKK